MAPRCHSTKMRLPRKKNHAINWLYHLSIAWMFFVNSTWDQLEVLSWNSNFQAWKPTLGTSSESISLKHSWRNGQSNFILHINQSIILGPWLFGFKFQRDFWTFKCSHYDHPKSIGWIFWHSLKRQNKHLHKQIVKKHMSHLSFGFYSFMLFHHIFYQVLGNEKNMHQKPWFFFGQTQNWGEISIQKNYSIDTSINLWHMFPILKP